MSYFYYTSDSTADVFSLLTERLYSQYISFRVIIFVILMNSFLLTIIQAVHIIDSTLVVHLVSQGQAFHLLSDTW